MVTRVDGDQSGPANAGAALEEWESEGGAQHSIRPSLPGTGDEKTAGGSPESGPGGSEQDLLERQRGLENEVFRWHGDLLTEGTTTDGGQNEVNVRALKARRTILLEQSQLVTQQLNDVRRIRKGEGSGVESWFHFGRK